MTISKKIFLTGLTAILVSSLAFTQAAPMPKMNYNTNKWIANALNPKVQNIQVKSFNQKAFEYLSDYTAQNGYNSFGIYEYNEGASSVLNKLLREGGSNERTRVIHEFLKNQRTSESMIVYRGGIDYIAGRKIGWNGKNYVALDSGKKIGKGLTGADKGFLSASTNIDIANEFMNNTFRTNNKQGFRVLEKIIVPKGANAYFLNNINPFTGESISYFGRESEWLFDSGVKRIVTDLEWNGGVLHVTEKMVTENQYGKMLSKLTKNDAFAVGMMTKKARRQLTRIEKLKAKGILENKTYVGSSAKKKAVGTLKSFAKKHPKTMKFCSGVLKSAPIIIEVAVDLYDMYKEVDKYYSGQFTKRNLAISLAGVAGGIAGGAAGGWLGVKAGAAIGSLIAPGVGTAIGSIVGGIIGGFAGYELGSYLGKNLMAMATAKYHSTMQSNYYFNNLCNNIAEDCEKKNLKPISA